MACTYNSYPVDQLRIVRVFVDAIRANGHNDLHDVANDPGLELWMLMPNALDKVR